MYNKMMLFGDRATSVLDSIAITKNYTDNRDVVMNLVISNMKIVTNWIEFYGLNIIDTMQLDYHTYHVMLKEIQDYNNEIKKATKKFKDKTDAQNKALLHQGVM